MLYPSEYVTQSDGSKIALFEALRQALKQIVQDRRLIGDRGRACFITFGTKITEKSDWPTRVATEVNRRKLLTMIDSPDELSADKHGDTYMAGALSLALQRANQLYSESDPCTTTFVVMLTDGWDEPPTGTTLKVRDVASRLLVRAKELQSKVGVKTMQVLVVGLQNLPNRKAGTTTARELADLLDGSFIDVTRQSGGTVSEKIFSALKQTVGSLRGNIKIASSTYNPSIKQGLLDFGTVGENGSADSACVVESRSCYAEEIFGVSEVSGGVSNANKTELLRKAHAGNDVTSQFVSSLPPGAITVGLSQSQFSVVPQLDENGVHVLSRTRISLTARTTAIVRPGVLSVV